MDFYGDFLLEKDEKKALDLSLKPTLEIKRPEPKKPTGEEEKEKKKNKTTQVIVMDSEEEDEDADVMKKQKQQFKDFSKDIKKDGIF